MSEVSHITSPSFTVASSGENLRYAARAGDLTEACDVLKRYKDTGPDNPLSKLLPAVLASGDSLSGNKALHLCAANGHLDLVRLLLEHKADVNATNLSGSTALHYASLNGQLEIVQELIKYYANPVVENKYGNTALDEARLGGKNNVAEFLLDHVERTGSASNLSNETNERATEGDSKN